MAKEYSADIIAQSFIKQYYEVLAKQPESLFRFYKEDSHFSFSEGTHPTTVAVGIQAINNRVLEIGFLGSRVDLSEGSIDAHKNEAANSILIVVTGEFSFPAKGPRLFVQTFYLAGQNTTYYCRNSVLRLLSQPNLKNIPHTAAQVPLVEHAHAQVQTNETQQHRREAEVKTQPAPVAAPAPAPVAAPVEPVVEAPKPAPVAAPAPAPVAAPVAAPAASPVAQKPVVAPVPAPAPAPVVEEPKGPRSYSDMVKRTLTATPAVAAPAAVRPARVVNKPVATTTAPAAKAADAAATTSSDASKTNKPRTANTTTTPVRSASLYVSKLPADTTAEELQTLLAEFSVRRVDIVADKSFAFVDVESEANVRAAVAKATETPFSIRGTAIKVDERRATAPKKTFPANSNGNNNKTGDRNASNGDKSRVSPRANKDGTAATTTGERKPRENKPRNANTEAAVAPAIATA